MWFIELGLRILLLEPGKGSVLLIWIDGLALYLSLGSSSTLMSGIRLLLTILVANLCLSCLGFIPKKLELAKFFLSFSFQKELLLNVGEINGFLETLEFLETLLLRLILFRLLSLKIFGIFLTNLFLRGFFKKNPFLFDTILLPLLLL
jgi:hypothetical protein